MRAIIVMGPSGCGKSTLGVALADALGYRFIEGDALHPPANIDKMAAGIALDDEDRQPFLENVARAIVETKDPGVVVACSALKRSYRDFICSHAGEVTFVLPDIDHNLLRARLSGRAEHFMPSLLLESQLATLERPQPDERAILISADNLAEQVKQVIARL